MRNILLAMYCWLLSSPGGCGGGATSIGDAVIDDDECKCNDLVDVALDGVPAGGELLSMAAVECRFRCSAAVAAAASPTTKMPAMMEETSNTFGQNQLQQVAIAQQQAAQISQQQTQAQPQTTTSASATVSAALAGSATSVTPTTIHSASSSPTSSAISPAPMSPASQPPALPSAPQSGAASQASAPSISQSAKMNPLDVTFYLFTRYHRDMARELAQLATSTATMLSSASHHHHHHHHHHHNMNTAATSLTPDTFAGASELIDLTNETTLSESRLNSSLPIKVIIHGFGSGGRRPWVTEMVYKLLDYEDVNVVVVDWEKGAALPNYVQAAGNTRLVGHKIACLIKSINAKYGLTGNSYHLIGFSLGAHVAGFAGMEIRNSTSVSRLWINRITGLDPASPLFEGYEANDRLDPSDAQFVDVIHSNGDGVLRGGFGSLQPMGHVDFYPNGGRVQVGCNSVILSALSDIIYGKWQSLCNHRRALNFFMDSFEFNKCRFRSFNCDSYENYLKGECFDCGQNNEKCSYMGYLANYSKGRGKMYLTTHEEAPFCANQFIIKILGTKGYKTHWGKVEVTLVTLDGKNESFLLSSMNVGQQSNGGHHELGAGGQAKDNSQHSMQSLIVAHPTLVNFTQILLRYTKYKGWIYSGDESWSIDKVFIMDNDGQVKSFCGYNTVLESHITTRLNLEPGDCTVVEQPAQQQQVSRVGAASSMQQQQQQQVVSATVQQQQQQQQQQQTPQPSARTPRLFSPDTLAFSRIPAKPTVEQQVQLSRHQLQLQRQQQQVAQLALVYGSNGMPLLAF